MSVTRRDFVKVAGAVGAATLLSGAARASTVRARPQRLPKGKAEKPLRILFLGGTGFLGPHCVRTAIERGHEVTLFNRGRSDADLFTEDEVEQLTGDRTESLEPLGDREWDVCIDTANQGSWVRRSAEHLKDKVKQYIFISSVSAYASHAVVGMDETAELARRETTEDLSPRVDFAGAKVQCEDAARDVFGDRAMIIRPGLIVGPRDWSDRFTYWPVRVRDGGEVLAPGDGETRCQWIDVRDLGEWMVHAAEAGLTGEYNATGPANITCMEQLLTLCRATTAADASFTWVDAEFLEGQQVSPWMNLPLWIPPVGDYAGFSSVSWDKAKAAGLTHRAVDETIHDLMEWWDTLPAERRARVYEPRTGRLSREREAQVLAAFRSQG